MIPPGQSTGELVKALGTSKSSTSTMSRLLEQVGLIDRYRKPGSREMHHRVTPGAWQTVFERQGDEIINLRRLAERDIAAVGNDTNRGNRLVEMRDAFLFWEREWPALMERWKKGTT